MRLKDTWTARVGSAPGNFAPLTVAATPGIAAIRTADGRPVAGGLADTRLLTATGTTTETSGAVQVYDGAALVATALLTGAPAWSAVVAVPLRGVRPHRCHRHHRPTGGRHHPRLCCRDPSGGLQKQTDVGGLFFP